MRQINSASNDGTQSSWISAKFKSDDGQAEIRINVYRLNK